MGRIAGGWTLNLTTSTSPTPAPGPLVSPRAPNIAPRVDTKGTGTKQKILRQRGVVIVFTSNVAAKLAATGTVKAAKTYKFRGAKRNVSANKRTMGTFMPASALCR